MARKPQQRDWTSWGNPSVPRAQKTAPRERARSQSVSEGHTQRAKS